MSEGTEELTLQESGEIEKNRHRSNHSTEFYLWHQYRIHTDTKTFLVTAGSMVHCSNGWCEFFDLTGLKLVCRIYKPIAVEYLMDRELHQNEYGSLMEV